nr:hypothetical protein [uncultured Chryseobacterium sp.]
MKRLEIQRLEKINGTTCFLAGVVGYRIIAISVTTANAGILKN